MYTSIYIVLVFGGMMLATCWKDMTSMTIPNWISLVLIAGFLLIAPRVMTSWGEFGTHILAGLLCLVIGFSMFAAGGLGGGDAKLFAATALWWNWPDLMTYVMITVLAGGVIALFLLVGRRFLPVRLLTTDWMHRLFRDEKKMPYGLALAFGAIVTMIGSETYPIKALFT